jgi:hypothetical protein
MSSAATTLGRWAVWKWIAVGALGAGTVVATKAVILARPADATIVTVPQAPPASLPASRARRDSVAAPSASASAVESAPLPSSPSIPDLPSPSPKVVIDRAPAPRAQTPMVETRPLPSVAPISKLSAEIAAIDQAKRALASNDADETLRRVEVYRAEFPGGMLAAEATGLRVQALARAGRRDEARAELARLRASHPESPLLENLAPLVGE